MIISHHFFMVSIDINHHFPWFPWINHWTYIPGKTMENCPSFQVSQVATSGKLGS